MPRRKFIHTQRRQGSLCSAQPVGQISKWVNIDRTEQNDKPDPKFIRVKSEERNQIISIKSKALSEQTL